MILHVVDLGCDVPVLPRRRRIRPLLSSIGVHAIAASAFVSLITGAALPEPPAMSAAGFRADDSVEIQHIVFLLPQSAKSGGGGGGGNRQTGPVRHAESVGTDDITLRVARPTSTTGRAEDAAVLPGIVLDARPLASGSAEQIGLPIGGVSFGTSTGPGSGGGVGDGVGAGIGSGRGSGIGPGSGGGIGGGVYLPGSGVTAPRVITEVKPSYTSKALLEKIQGTVVLEAVVRANGIPSNIRVIRSLDPDGLDGQAIAAVREWRFEPGRLAGKPVDVLVNVMLDFSIH